MTWKKLNVLVPEPDCNTEDGAITVVPGTWRDARTEPTQTEIDAVTLQEILDARVFSELQSWERASNVPIPLDEFVEVFRQVSRKLQEGFYKIDYSFEVNCTTGGLGTVSYIRCKIDDVIKSDWNYVDSFRWQTFTGFDLQEFAYGSEPVVTFEARGRYGTDVVDIRKIRVLIQKID